MILLTKTFCSEPETDMKTWSIDIPKLPTNDGRKAIPSNVQTCYS